MSSEIERKYIKDILIPEIMDGFNNVAVEYQQERDLGARGEFANLYRKARKLKTVLWDGADPSSWRESLRTIVKEVVSHGLLLLVDLDHGQDPTYATPAKEPSFGEVIKQAAGHAYDGCPVCVRTRQGYMEDGA